MEKGDTRVFHHGTNEHGWNIVELESHRQLRQTVTELIQLARCSSLTTREIKHYLQQSMLLFGNRLALSLVRALQWGDQPERESIVWLLTLLNSQETISYLQRIAHNERLSRPVRLSASLALAGMGATPEMNDIPRRKRLYAIS